MRGCVRRERGRLGWVVLLVLLAVGVHAEDYGRALERKYGLYPDFATNLRVQVIGQQLKAAAALPQVSFRVINQGDLNAMALPDGRIYVTSRMATEVPDDELAFILGHEMTHVKEHHARHQTERSTVGAILGAILTHVLGGDEADVRLGAEIAGNLTYGHYSRTDENRADAGGARLMARCGYDPARAADTMQRLIDRYGDGDADVPILGWFATHPDTNARKEHLQRIAQELARSPQERAALPLGVEITLAPSAEHAQAWAQDYLAYLIASYCDGRALAAPSPRLTGAPAPAPLADAAPLAGANAAHGRARGPEQAPLPAVTVQLPALPMGYRLTLALDPVQEGDGLHLSDTRGTAVAATLHWTEVATGFQGVIRATAQARAHGPWMAQQQLTGEALTRLDDGTRRNIEGTLEGQAVQRVARAFAELVEVGGPIHHAGTVSAPRPSGDVRVGDYVAVLRRGWLVSEICVEGIAGKKISGAVLWGSHTWQRGDRFVLER